MPAPGATTPDLELVSCPECHGPAEVEWRTGGPSASSEHLKIRCLHRHWFLLPSEDVI